MKMLRSAIAISVTFFVISVSARAQARLDAYFGMGTAQVGSSNEIDFIGTGLKTPSMVGIFGTFGGAVMLKPSIGVGGQATVRFAQGNYLGYGYRPVFYDFNGIWAPSLNRHVVPEFQGGLGGMSLRFYDPTNPYYDYNTGRLSTFAGSSNHFQLHAGFGLRFNVKPNIFLRPQIDYHWVPNLSEFGSNSVPAYSLVVGFTTGE